MCTTFSHNFKNITQKGQNHSCYTIAVKRRYQTVTAAGLVPHFHTGGARGSGHTAVSTYDTDDMRPPSHVSNGSALSNPVTGGYHSQRAEGEAGGPIANSGAAPGKVAYNEKTMLLSSDDEFQ